MISLSERKIVTFRRPFFLASVGRELPPGKYEVVTDQELIESLLFPVYRRTGTTMMVPAEASRGVEMQRVDPQQLEQALVADAHESAPGFSEDHAELYRPLFIVSKLLWVEGSTDELSQKISQEPLAERICSARTQLPLRQYCPPIPI